MWVEACGWVRVCLTKPPTRELSGRVVLNFWFVLWVRVGTLNKTANYGRISKFRVPMEESWQNASIYYVKIFKHQKVNPKFTKIYMSGFLYPYSSGQLLTDF